MIRSLPLALLFLFASTNLTAQWERTNGPFGGHVTTMFVHETGIYAGTWNAGAFRSVDDGRTWQALDTTNRLATVNSFRSHGSLLYSGTSKGVMVSDDGGTHWRLLPGEGLPDAAFAVPPIVYDIAWQGETMFAAVTGGVYRSTDNGATWAKSGTGQVVSGVKALYANDSVVLAGSNGAVDGAIYRSTNGGDTWSRASSFTGHDAMEFLPHSSGILAATDRGVFRSIDNGLNWVRLGAGGPSVDIAEAPDGTLYSSATSRGGLYRSTDAGTTWTAVDEGFADRTFGAVAATATTVLCNPYRLGIYRSSNRGESWSVSTEGFAASDVWAVAASGTSLIVGTEYNGLQRSDDLGVTWQQIGGSFASRRVWTVAASGELILAGTAGDYPGNPSLYRSLDNGASWTRLSQSTSGDVVDEIFIDRGEIFMSIAGRVSRSIDSGSNWVSAGTGITGSKVNTFFAAGDTLFAGANTGLYRSTNRGVSWTKIGVAPGGSNDVLSVAVTGDTINAGTSGGGICRSVDGGATWTRKFATGSSIPSMIRLDTLLLASTDGFGIFQSSDNGATWKPYLLGLPRRGAIDFVAHKGYLFTGIRDGSVARLALDRPTVFVREIVLEQGVVSIHPNPAGDQSVRVRFPAVIGRGRLQVYSATGTPMLEQPVVEASSLDLDIAKLPPGVYFIRTSSDGGIYTGRLLVL